VKAGFAVLPMVVCIAAGANLSNIVLLPRLGPRPIIPVALLIGAAGMVWLTRIGPHSSYPGYVLGPLMVTGFGLGNLFSTAINTGTFGVAPQDAGVASASVNTGQQLGGSIGTSLLNTVVATATSGYLTANLHGRLSGALMQQALVHGYVTAFWWSAWIFAGGAVLTAALLRSGPLTPRSASVTPERVSAAP
jgi:hypothetical protein